MPGWDTNIYKQKLEQIREEKLIISPEQMKERAAQSGRIALDFKGALEAAHPGVIAPISDTAGTDPAQAGRIAEERAVLYQEDGAQCFAVEGRWRFFNERETFFRPIRERMGVPILCCDYTIDTYQVHEAAVLGVDAILLVGSLLTDEAQFLLVSEAHRCGLQTVILVDSAGLAADAVKAGTDMVAASNISGPSSFDLTLTKTILSDIPPTSAKLSFGGITTETELEQVASYGAIGALVEASFLRAQECR